MKYSSRSSWQALTLSYILTPLTDCMSLVWSYLFFRSAFLTVNQSIAKSGRSFVFWAPEGLLTPVPTLGRDDDDTHTHTQARARRPRLGASTLAVIAAFSTWRLLRLCEDILDDIVA
jgi:hypothetical protein